DPRAQPRRSAADTQGPQPRPAGGASSSLAPSEFHVKPKTKAGKVILPGLHEELEGQSPSRDGGGLIIETIRSRSSTVANSIWMRPLRRPMSTRTRVSK